MVLLADALQFAAEERVGAHATGDGHLAHMVVQRRTLGFLEQEADDGLLYAGAEVGFVLLNEVGVFLQLVAQEIEERSLDAAERVVIALDVGCGEVERVGVSLFGEPVDDGAARVAEVHNLGRLVDGLAGSIVDSGAETLDVEVVFQQQYLRVSSADQQADERELRLRFAPVDEVAQHMSLQVVDFDKGFPQRRGKAFGKADADEQRAQQSGAAGEADGVDFAFVDARLTDGGIHHGNDILLVGTAGQLGHHTTVLFVNFLACNHIGEQPVVAKHSCRCVVAAGFYS